MIFEIWNSLQNSIEFLWFILLCFISSKNISLAHQSRFELAVFFLSKMAPFFNYYRFDFSRSQFLFARTGKAHHCNLKFLKQSAQVSDTQCLLTLQEDKVKKVFGFFWILAFFRLSIKQFLFFQKTVFLKWLKFVFLL